MIVGEVIRINSTYVVRMSYNWAICASICGSLLYVRVSLCKPHVSLVQVCCVNLCESHVTLCSVRFAFIHAGVDGERKLLEARSSSVYCLAQGFETVLAPTQHTKI